jgi:hypothetical protein
MLYALISIIIGFLIGLAFVLAWLAGLRLGMRSAKGVEPPSINPVHAVKNAVERRKLEKKIQEIEDEWALFDKFDGYTDEERVMMEQAKGNENG